MTVSVASLSPVILVVWLTLSYLRCNCTLLTLPTCTSPLPYTLTLFTSPHPYTLTHFISPHPYTLTHFFSSHPYTLTHLTPPLYPHPSHHTLTLTQPQVLWMILGDSFSNYPETKTKLNIILQPLHMLSEDCTLRWQICVLFLAFAREALHNQTLWQILHGVPPVTADCTQ